MTLDLICLGEAMGEIGFAPDGSHTIGVGGDTFNTAVYLARAGMRAGFGSMVGSDPFGMRIREMLHENAVDDRFLLTSTRATTGLYSISNDASGERFFHYWRAQAAARSFWDEATPEALDAIAQTPMIYLSGISLYTFDDSRDALFSLLERARAQGARIAFDGNYRPRLWAGREDHARDMFARALSLSHMAFPTFDDEQLMWGDSSTADCLARMQGYGVETVVLKSGAEGCVIRQNGLDTHVPIPAPVVPVDTTAAGDSFNAGYLAAHLQGARAQDAAIAGHKLAGRVIAHRGAILPRD
ncbi:2-dehydro-3-deoxygluconokinase [Aquimixticola soesokkakensis]|uniref:2-dehydro-3-deoxygluconokinase n=1 Tax=Aquimixticola soesokkakensis TaxID=1519096 RepID=A0A1Y5RSH4_9RHOB|nr:sugar kinase [Aquimixticola soesokkakensis]SLN24045.1 2-dehydro-3-deoxygluconokinase [Aquimixticola soesokkakensis]